MYIKRGENSIMLHLDGSHFYILKGNGYRWGIMAEGSMDLTINKTAFLNVFHYIDNTLNNSLIGSM